MYQKHTVQVGYRSPKIFSAAWVTTVNLHPYDSGHVDTCYIQVTQCKPTERQLRRIKKYAMKHKRPVRLRRYDEVLTQ